jgi:hypothetical protein
MPIVTETVIARHEYPFLFCLKILKRRTLALFDLLFLVTMEKVQSQEQGRTREDLNNSRLSDYAASARLPGPEYHWVVSSKIPLRIPVSGILISHEQNGYC